MSSTWEHRPWLSEPSFRRLAASNTLSNPHCAHNDCKGCKRWRSKQVRSCSRGGGGGSHTESVEQHPLCMALPSSPSVGGTPAHAGDCANSMGVEIPCLAARMVGKVHMLLMQCWEQQLASFRLSP